VRKWIKMVIDFTKSTHIPNRLFATIWREKYLLEDPDIIWGRNKNDLKPNEITFKYKFDKQKKLDRNNKKCKWKRFIQMDEGNNLLLKERSNNKLQIIFGVYCFF
jgi:hypothetical protein